MPYIERVVNTNYRRTAALITCTHEDLFFFVSSNLLVYHTYVDNAHDEIYEHTNSALALSKIIYRPRHVYNL